MVDVNPASRKQRRVLLRGNGLEILSRESLVRNELRAAARHFLARPSIFVVRRVDLSVRAGRHAATNAAAGASLARCDAAMSVIPR